MTETELIIDLETEQYFYILRHNFFSFTFLKILNLDLVQSIDFVSWMEADLNTSLQSTVRNGQGLREKSVL